MPLPEILKLFLPTPEPEPAKRRVQFHSPPIKLTIGSIDDKQLEVSAQYNPKDLQIDRSVPWLFHNARDNRPGGRRAPREHDAEYKGGPGRSITIELLFDHYESGVSVEPLVEKLDRMACVTDVGSIHEAERRPHRCLVAWGQGSGTVGMRSLRCVIESIATKYTMFAADGTPLRATCTVKLREAEVVKLGKR